MKEWCPVALTCIGSVLLMFAITGALLVAAGAFDKKHEHVCTCVEEGAN